MNAQCSISSADKTAPSRNLGEKQCDEIVLNSLSLPYFIDRLRLLPLFSDFVLSWPLSAPADAVDRDLSSSEATVIELFDETRDSLLRYLLAMGLSLHDGEEIIQESFLLLFQHLRAGKSRRNLRGWIFRVARNLALKQRSANRLQMLNIVEFDDAAAGLHTKRDLNPEEQLRNKRRQARLLAVVHALPERDQSCLYMRAEGVTYREIAKALGISLGSVAASLAQSLGKLGRADGG
jgi:RNA polymerase sigma-70 factor, ECF subfamily